jgi:hypothetical protein
MWELIFMVLILKIPLVYVCWVVWWAIKAEPAIGSEGEPVHHVNWTPWRRPDRPRPRRGGPHGHPHEAARATRRRERAES